MSAMAAAGIPKLDAGPQKSVRDARVNGGFLSSRARIGRKRLTGRTEVIEPWVRAYFGVQR